MQSSVEKIKIKINNNNEQNKQKSTTAKNNLKLPYLRLWWQLQHTTAYVINSRRPAWGSVFEDNRECKDDVRGIKENQEWNHGAVNPSYVARIQPKSLVTLIVELFKSKVREVYEVPTAIQYAYQFPEVVEETRKKSRKKSMRMPNDIQVNFNGSDLLTSAKQNLAFSLSRILSSWFLKMTEFLAHFYSEL